MSSLPTLPDGLELTRTTKVFDNDTAPAGLLKAHQVAEGVWARLVMHSGSAGFVFEDTPDELITVADGGNVVIPPQRLHHVVLGEPATFVVEFYRPSAEEEADRETVTFSTGFRGSPGPIDPK